MRLHISLLQYYVQFQLTNTSGEPWGVRGCVVLDGHGTKVIAWASSKPQLLEAEYAGAIPAARTVLSLS